MTKEILVPENHDASKHYHNPYTESGARSILRRFRNDVIAMFDEMLQDVDKYGPGAKTMLANSCLRNKPYIAGAMKTLGFIEEHPTANGACGLMLTEKAILQLENLRKYL